MRRFYLFTGLFLSLELLLWFLDRSGIWPGLLEGWTGLLLLLPFAGWLTFLVWASSSICSGVYLPAVCHGRRDSERVALTFDDGPDEVNLPRIMDILDRHGFRASFFFVGSRCEGRYELIREVALRGHLAGNHSWSHSFHLPFSTGKKLRQELERTTAVLESAGAGPVLWYRPPFGVSNPRVYRGWRHSGLKVAGWSIRSFDTRGEETGVVAERILGKLKGGDIILLHESSPHILDLLELLLPALVERGLKSVTLEELCSAQAG